MGRTGEKEVKEKREKKLQAKKNKMKVIHSIYRFCLMSFFWLTLVFSFLLDIRGITFWALCRFDLIVFGSNMD